MLIIVAIHPFCLVIRGRLLELHRERSCGVLTDLGFYEEDSAEGGGCLSGIMVNSIVRFWWQLAHVAVEAATN